MNRLILFYILIGITVSSKAASDKSQEKNNNKTSVTNLDAKDKRQIDNGQIGLYPQFQQQQQQQQFQQLKIDDQQGADSIYSSDPNQFVIRAVNGNRRAQYNVHNVQEQEITSPYAYQELGPRQQPNRNAQKFKQQSAPQFQPAAAYQQRIIPEEQLLKLLEDELAAKGIHVHHQQPLSKQQDKKLINLKYQQAIEKSKSGLGNYRQASQQKPDNIEYVYVPQQVYQQSQPPQAQPQLIQQQPQQHHHSIPPGHAQANLEYHRNIPNHPLAASTLEKEIEKLFASNKPNAARYEQLQNPYKVSKVQEKNYTPAPVAPSEKEYSFLPSLAQFSGFKQEPEPAYHESEHSSREYLPKTAEKQGHGQYLSEKQNIKPLAGPYQFEQPKQQPLYQHYFAYQTTKSPPRKQHHQQQQHQIQQTQFIPIPNPENKNLAMKVIDAPKLHAGNGPTPSQGQLYYSKQKSQQSEEAADDEKLRYNGQQPSRSTIYVAQGTGVAQHQQSPPTRHQQNHSHKSQNENSKKIRLPPPDGKPITQEEFQALVDAGYPVQAVPVPVPVPYEEYVKTHPEYAQQPQSQQHQHQQQQQQHQQQQQQQQVQQQQQQHQHQLQHQQNQQGPQQASESQQYTSSIRYGPGITHLKPIQGKHSH